MRRASQHPCYLLRRADGTLYTGINTDPDRRLRAHNAARGARHTASRLPVALAWTKTHSTAPRPSPTLRSPPISPET